MFNINVRLLFGALLTAALACSQAGAGSLTLMGVGGPAASGGGGPALDGSAAFSTSNTVTLTTSQPNDVIIVIAGGGGSTGTGVVTDAGSHTWTRRISTADNAGSRVIEEFWAIASSPLSSDVITYSSGSVAITGLISFGISGANTSTPFDTNVSLPTLTNGTTATPTATGVSTSNANDFLIAGAVGSGSGPPTAGSPFTLLYGSAALPVVAGEYDVVSVTQSGITVTLPISGTTSWGFFVDAVQ